MAGISTADKRALLDVAGEPWPLYPDGTKQVWLKKGKWRSYASQKRCREITSAWSRREQRRPGPCGMKGCSKPKHQCSSGLYANKCLEHKRKARRQYSHTLKGVQSSHRLDMRRSIERGNQRLQEAGLSG